MHTYSNGCIYKAAKNLNQVTAAHVQFILFDCTVRSRLVWDIHYYFPIYSIYE